MSPQPYDFSLPVTAIETSNDSKDRLIDALQMQLSNVREELRSTQHELSITEAKLSEARRALDRCMGMHS